MSVSYIIHRGTQSTGCSVSLLLVAVLSGCGGGGDAVEPTVTTAGLVDLDSTRSIQGTRFVANHPDDMNPSAEPVLSEEQLKAMEDVERASFDVNSPSAASVGRARLQAAFDAGFDSASSYSVGFVGEELGPVGQALKARPGQTATILSAARSGVVPDLVYVRADARSLKTVQESTLFQQALKQRKSFLVERDAAGSRHYENFLYNVFKAAPKGTDAVLVRPVGTESYAYYLIDDDDTSDPSVPSARNFDVQGKSSKPAALQLQMDRIAGAVVPYSPPSLGESFVPDTRLATSSAASARAAAQPAHMAETNVTFTVGTDYYIQQNGSWVVDTRETREAYLVDATGRWGYRGDHCNRFFFGKLCAGYGNTLMTYGAWAPQYVNTVWWDDWLRCGDSQVIPGANCTTSYETIRKTINGTIQGVTAETDVSLSISNEASFLSFEKAKLESTITARSGYNKSWNKAVEVTFDAKYQNIIPSGYSTRFGRGNYTMMVPHWFHGRWERDWPVEMYFYTGYPLACSKPAAGPDFHFNGNNVTYKVDCTAMYNANFLQRAQIISLKTVGMKHWAICKNTDAACFNTYENGTLAQRSALFPL